MKHSGFVTSSHWPTPLAEFSVRMQETATRHPFQAETLRCLHELDTGACGARSAADAPVPQVGVKAWLLHAMQQAATEFLNTSMAHGNDMTLRTRVLSAHSMPSRQPLQPFPAAPGHERPEGDPTDTFRPHVAGLFAVTTDSNGVFIPSKEESVASVEIPDPR